jgi:hypothetical protein
MVFSEDDSPVERHLVADLSVAYAFDEPKCFVMVARRDLVRLRLDNSSISRRAIWSRSLAQRTGKGSRSCGQESHRCLKRLTTRSHAIFL